MHVKRLCGEPVVVRLRRWRAVETTDVGRIPGEAGDIPLRLRVLTGVQQSVEKLVFLILLACQPRRMLVDKRQRRLNLLKGDKRGDDPADGPVGNGLLLRDQALVFADDLRVLGAGVQCAQTINTRPDDVGRSLWVGVPGGDHRVILRERRAGQRVTRLFFAGRGIGKAHQFGGGVQLQVTLFRRRQFDAIRQAESRGINPVAGQGRHQAGQRGFVLRITIEDLRVHQQLVPAFAQPQVDIGERLQVRNARLLRHQATRFAERLAVLAGIGQRLDIADTIVVTVRGLAESLLPEEERGLPLFLVAQSLRGGGGAPCGKRHIDLIASPDFHDLIVLAGPEGYLQPVGYLRRG